MALIEIVVDTSINTTYFAAQAFCTIKIIELSKQGAIAQQLVRIFECIWLEIQFLAWFVNQWNASETNRLGHQLCGIYFWSSIAYAVQLDLMY